MTGAAAPDEEAGEEGSLSRVLATSPGLMLVAVALGVMWATELIDLIAPGQPLDRWGIRPRSWRGLVGIPLAPFLHFGFRHLISNSIPFALLGAAIALGGRQRIVEVIVTTGVVSGAGVWVFGRSNSIHLGASGVVFGFITYLVSRGFFAKRLWWILGGAIVAIAYGGSLIWGIVPTTRVSWLGHLFGALGGVLAAWMIHADHDLDDEETL